MVRWQYKLFRFYIFINIVSFSFFFKRYTAEIRSKSRTPPHWRLAAEERKPFVEINESRKQSSIEQTNSNEHTVDILTQSTEQIHNRETIKCNRSYLKNGDTNDENETSTNNTDEQSIRDSTKRTRRHEKRREIIDDNEELQQPQPTIQSSILRPEPKRT